MRTRAERCVDTRFAPSRARALAPVSVLSSLTPVLTKLVHKPQSAEFGEAPESTSGATGRDNSIERAIDMRSLGVAACSHLFNVLTASISVVPGYVRRVINIRRIVSMVRIARPVGVLIAAIAAVVPATSVFAATGATSTTLYNSMVPSPGNVPSQAFEATQTSQFGNEITMTRSAKIASVVVTMSSWGCQSGSWSNDTCSTTPGSKFTEPITLNLYQAPSDPNANNGAPGALILSVTKTFSIPYRPSANNTKCVGAESGEWFDGKLGTCFNGMATNITFNLSSLRLTLPKTLVFGIAYNTSDYGASPYGDATACHSTSEGCGYDSLNVGLAQDPDNLNVGTDPHFGTAWLNTDSAPYYCDNGAAGTGAFRFDSPNSNPSSCASGQGGWSVYGGGTAPYYIPAVAFNAAA